MTKAWALIALGAALFGAALYIGTLQHTTPVIVSPRIVVGSIVTITAALGPDSLVPLTENQTTFGVKPGTHGRVIDADAKNVRLRILDGDSSDRAGWTKREWVK